MKYPKFFLFIITIIVAYIIFKGNSLFGLGDFINKAGYLGVFICGILYAYGFTSAFAVAVFLILGDGFNVVTVALIGGLGSFLGDLVIFKFIKGAFSDEVDKLSKEKIVLYISKKIPRFFSRYFVPVIGVIIIASPLPDEIGVSLLAVSKKMTPKVFYFVSFLLNTLGILAILLIGR